MDNFTRKKRFALLLFLFNFLVESVYAQSTYVPDDNFEQKLIDLGYDDVLDNYVLTANISGVTSLNVGNSSISDLTGIEAFVNLTELWCHNNDLTSLDVSNNTALTDLVCANNPLTSLDVSTNTALTKLWCGGNNFTTLDVSTNTALTSFWCYDCGLTTLDVSNNTALTDLNVWGNSFTELDVSVNTALTSFACSSNQLTSLDVSNNTGLITLQCSDNQLTNLNVANGNNTNMTVMRAENNPNLTCIQHDTGFSPSTQPYDATNYTGWNKDTTAGWSTNCANYTVCTTAVNIPDANFRNALLAHGTTITGTGISTIDTNGDGIICQDEAAAYTGVINVSNQSITDLTGIEAFVNATELYCWTNQLTTLDVSSNTALTVLDFYDNQLTSIDVSANIALVTLWASNNQLTNINLGSNTSLIYLYCSNNQLASLNVSANTALTRLYCSGNQLASLNISNNTALTRLYCYDNQLTNLDVSSNTALTHFTCSNNQLTDLDISNNTALTYLGCAINQLTSLDVSGHSALTRLFCDNNQLTSLNVANGNNTNMTVMWTHNNPNLTCIQHDTSFSPNTQPYDATNYTGWNKDATAAWSTDCANYTVCTTAVNIPDDNFRNALLAHGTTITGTGISTIDTNGDGIICQDEAAAYTGVINVSNQSITDLTGIEAFVNATSLYCSGNQLTALDVSSNTQLQWLDCLNNQLTALDVSNNTELQVLICGINQLTALDISNNTAMTILSCFSNQLTALDISNNTAMTLLSCSYNQLTSLDVSNNTSLTSLYCQNNQLSSLDVSNNTSLTNLSCHYNQLTSLDVSNNASLTFLECANNSLTSLNVANGNNENFVEQYSNYGKAFDASGNANLSCIQVDSGFTPPTTGSNQWVKDATASYNETCASLGTDEVEIVNELISVYPNPTKDNVFVKTTLTLENIQIFDMSGRLVKEVKTKQFSVSDLPEGMYLLRINTEKGIVDKKLIKK